MVKIPILQAMAWLERYEPDCVARWAKLKELLIEQSRATELRNEAEGAGDDHRTDEAVPGVADDISELWE